MNDENKPLHTQIVKLEYQHEIARINGFEEGYKAGQRDARQGRQR